MGRVLLAKESCILLMLVTVNVYSQSQADNGLKQAVSYTSMIQADKDTHTANVEAALFVFISNATVGDKSRVEVLVLRDPKTGLSWWGFHKNSDAKPDENLITRYIGDYIFYLSDDAIGSVMLSGADLWIKESLEKYPSMDDAKSEALKAFESGLLKKDERKLFYTMFKAVDIGKHIPLEFFRGDLRYSGNRVLAKLKSVQKQGTNWMISMLGADSAKLDVEVNDKHQVAKTILYPAHKAKD